MCLLMMHARTSTISFSATADAREKFNSVILSSELHKDKPDFL
jgi:hypothetical protein